MHACQEYAASNEVAAMTVTRKKGYVYIKKVIMIRVMVGWLHYFRMMVLGSCLYFTTNIMLVL